MPFFTIVKMCKRELEGMKSIGNKVKEGWRSRIVDTVTTLFLIAFICAALAFNLISKGIKQLH